MNILKDILTKLKELGCNGIKVSLEDEGALYNEIVTMRYLTAISNIELDLKIGGCEAKSDIKNCIDINCDKIIAPMIESEYALKKFVDAIESSNYKGKKSFNLETINGYNNFDECIDLLKNFESITFGRVDYVNSINKNREFVNSDVIYNSVYSIFEKSKKHGLKCNLGGSINIESKDFIKKLIDSNLLDNFETRYVVFDTNKINLNNFNELIYFANLFEIEWMKYIQNRYLNNANKDSKRINMIQERLNNNK